MNLSTNLSAIKGVGPKTAEQFRAAGLETVGDLINFLPRKHEDFSEVARIADLTPGKHTVRAKVVSIDVKRVKRGMTVTTAVLEDESGKVRASWFNQPYRKTQFGSDTYVFSGEFEFRYNRYQLTNPSAEKVSEVKQQGAIVPVYRSIKGLKSQLVRKILRELQPFMTMLPDTLPASVVQSEKLLSTSEALLKIHFPDSREDVTLARERIAFEELFSLVLASQLNQSSNLQLEGNVIKPDMTTIKALVAQLPFQLTDAQRIAAWEIMQEIEQPTPMNRLLQGDVGSGKTVVAALAAVAAANAGYQTAIMAPTEILARQHAETLRNLLHPLGIDVALLVGAVKPTARKELLRHIGSGDIKIVVGTHALFQDSVRFDNLGLVVIDEQHRFGVAQRQKLLAKAHKMPHLLAMTATPIPRSLQLTVFGELAISVLASKPANRKPIITKLISPVSASSVYQKIDALIAAGQQAYVICSLIDDSPASDKKSVEAEYKKLRSTVFRHRSIGLLHGRMKPDEKEQVMADFAAEKYDILVSTTVVEVGVDVPNATVICIENADHFGLAQLHQLRGRVGRGDQQSYCYLMLSDTRKPSERLREIERSQDGFYLAEVDLKLRGPGEIYGRAQHGDLNLQVASFADTRLIKRVHAAAQQFLAQDKSLLHYTQLAAEVERYQRLTTLN